MASSKNGNTQNSIDREKVLSNLRSRPEEIFHIDKELAFSRDAKGKRLFITDLDHGLIVEVDVPFTEEFAVGKVKMDKDRKGFTMSGWQGEVWFDLKSCWKQANPLVNAADSPFPEIIIDQDGDFSIFQDLEGLTIECPLLQVGEIKLKAGETGFFHFNNVHKFRCYPVSDNTVIEYITPVPAQEYINPFLDQPQVSSPQDSIDPEIPFYDIFNGELDDIFAKNDFEEDMEKERLHFKWTIKGMFFECETPEISFSFSQPTNVWGAETDEFLYTTLLELDSFDKEDVRYMVDYFRTFEGDEVMGIIHQELADFLKSPDWDGFLKWGYDGTFTTSELRLMMTNILRHSVEYLKELGLDETRY